MSWKQGLRAMAGSLVVCASVCNLMACSGNYDSVGAGSSGASPSSTGELIALTATQHLVSLNRATPGSLVTNVVVSGLSSGERLFGIAWRPSEGKLLGLTSAARLFEVNALTGSLTWRANLAAKVGDSNPYAGLSGATVAVSFDASADRLRVLTSAGQNLVVDPVNGAVLTQSTLQRNSVVAAIGAAAYPDAFAGSTSSQLWTIDAATDALEYMPAPDSGVLTQAISLGVDATAVGGFVIDAHTGAAFATLTVNGRNALYSVALNASVSVATRIADLATQDPVLGLVLTDTKGNALAAQAAGLSTDGRLVKFQPDNPQIVTLVPVVGLNVGETLLGIDFRVADGNLYGVSSAGRVLRIDSAVGTVTQVSSLRAATADTTSPYAGLVGASFALNFDPGLDRLRMVGNTGQSLLVNVVTGEVVTDGNVHATAQASVASGLAHGDRYAGAAANALFIVDVAHQMLGTLRTPADGTVSDLGALGLPSGINPNGQAAFNITGGRNGLALLVVQTTDGGSVLFSVDLVSGAATPYPDANAATSAATNRVGGLGGPALKSLALKL